jgi:hypothetical protein
MKKDWKVDVGDAVKWLAVSAVIIVALCITGNASVLWFFLLMVFI